MAQNTSPPLVLVADDEPSMLELVARHLRTMSDPKLEVIQASDGEEAWRLAREHLPDLVVLDVMMPGMSGWEVCRKIREDVALAHTGVVMLTGIGENLNQMTSPLYGADAYIDKPFEFDDFDAKVKDTLKARAKQREGVVRPSINGTAGAAKPAVGRAAKDDAPKAKGGKAKPAKAKAPAKSKAKVAVKAAKKVAAKVVKAVKKIAGAKTAKRAPGKTNGIAAKAKPAKKAAAKKPAAKAKPKAKAKKSKSQSARR
jgi:DNA-binding response OmpR family regulator